MCTGCGPTGDISTKAVIIESRNNTCDEVRTAGGFSTNTMFGSRHRLTNALIPYDVTGTQINTYYLGFTGLTVNNTAYTLTISDTYDGYIPVKSCQKITNGASVSYADNAPMSYRLNDNDKVEWDIGYVWGAPWFQAREGNVYSSTTIQSYIPAVTPRHFLLDGTGGYPGVILYGTPNGYDFAASLGSQGEASASSTRWLAEQQFGTQDYYTLFLNRFRQSSTMTAYRPMSLRGSGLC